MVALGIIVLWRFTRHWGWFIPHADDHIMTGGLIPTLGVAYSIMATHALTTAWRKFKMVEYCVTHDDLQRFLEIRDVKIPTVIHLLLGCLAFGLVICFLVLDYHQSATGYLAVSFVSFIVVLYQEVAIELDNPLTGIWTIEVPPEWITASPARKHRNGKEEHADCFPN
jgi:hypothetical protein